MIPHFIHLEILFFSYCVRQLVGDMSSHIIQKNGQFHKSQRFTIRKGECLEKSESDTLRVKLVTCQGMRFSKGSMEKYDVAQPAWEALAGSVLRLNAYIREAISLSSSESERIREFSILYYLVDDTISVFEPKVSNSGIIQGLFLKRGRVTGLDILQVEIGGVLRIHGHEFYIYDADKLTRDYFSCHGKPLGDPVIIPVGDVRRNLPRTTESKRENFEPLGRSLHVDSRKVMQYLENDKKVCRFFAVLRSDDQTRYFSLLYFLADNTVEIRENMQPNAGRDECSVFFRRGRLDSLGQPISSGNEVLDLRNLRVGSTISLCFQVFHIYDADKFTRDWFDSQHRVILDSKIDINTHTSKKNEAPEEFPPYTGYGSWEDSLGSVRDLCPKQPKKNSMKSFLNEGKVLRFRCRFDTPKIEDEGRKFILSFFLVDDQMSIHEPPVRNSGIIGGRYLEKGVYLNELTKRIFKQTDLKVGNVFQILGRRFILEECDDFTSNLLDPTTITKRGTKGSSALPIANELRKKLIQLMPQIHDTFRRFDKDGTDRITVDKFRDILTQFGFVKSDEDCLEIMQIFDTNKNGLISYPEFCASLDSEDLGSSGVIPVQEYSQRATQILKNDSEQELRLKAGKKLTEMLYARTTFSQRLMKEMGNLSNNSKIVSSSMLKEALDNLGICLPKVDIDRVLELVMQETESINAFDYFLFLKNVRILFHSVYPNFTRDFYCSTFLIKKTLFFRENEIIHQVIFFSIHTYIHIY